MKKKEKVFIEDTFDVFIGSKKSDVKKVKDNIFCSKYYGNTYNSIFYVVFSLILLEGCIFSLRDIDTILFGRGSSSFFRDSIAMFFSCGMIGYCISQFLWSFFLCRYSLIDIIFYFTPFYFLFSISLLGAKIIFFSNNLFGIHINNIDDFQSIFQYILTVSTFIGGLLAGVGFMSLSNLCLRSSYVNNSYFVKVMGITTIGAYLISSIFGKALEMIIRMYCINKEFLIEYEILFICIVVFFLIAAVLICYSIYLADHKLLRFNMHDFNISKKEKKKEEAVNNNEKKIANNENSKFNYRYSSFSFLFNRIFNVFFGLIRRARNACRGINVIHILAIVAVAIGSCSFFFYIIPIKTPLICETFGTHVSPGSLIAIAKFGFASSVLFAWIFSFYFSPINMILGFSLIVLIPVFYIGVPFWVKYLGFGLANVNFANGSLTSFDFFINHTKQYFLLIFYYLIGFCNISHILLFDYLRANTRLTEVQKQYLSSFANFVNLSVSFPLFLMESSEYMSEITIVFMCSIIFPLITLFLIFMVFGYEYLVSKKPIFLFISKKGTPPRCMTYGSHGYDLFSSEYKLIKPNSVEVVSTGLFVIIPAEGKPFKEYNYEIQIRSRSGLASKGLIVANAPGTIDIDYTGEIKVILLNTTKLSNFIIKKGDRIAQMVLALVDRITEYDMYAIKNESEIYMTDAFLSSGLSKSGRLGSGLGSTGV